MTPIERMNKLMKGLSWDEAEEVCREMMARCVAYHVFVCHDGEEFMHSWTDDIVNRSLEWSKKHSFELAAASVVYNRKKEVKDENDNS